MNKGCSKAKIFRLSGVAFLLGIVLSYFFSFKILPFILIGGIFYFLFVKTKFKSISFVILIIFIILSFIFGFLRYKIVLNSLLAKPDLSSFSNTSFKVISSYPLEQSQKLIIQPQVQFSQFKGGIVYLDLKPDYFKGDYLKIKKGQIVNLDEPFYSDGLLVYFEIKKPEVEKIAAKSIFNQAFLFREKLKSIFNYYLKEPQASLLNSLVFGRKGNLNKEIEEKINLAGLSHLVAVSGLHLVLLIKIISEFLKFFPLTKIIKFFILILFLLFFSLLAGLTPSVLRALVMALLVIFAELNFRIYEPFNSFLFTLCLMTYLNPLSLFYDLGFELSFLATFGIICFNPLLREQKLFKNLKLPNFLKSFEDTFFASLSSLIFVYPWIIFKTGQIIALVMLSNLLIVPIISWVLIFAFLLIICHFFYLPSLVLGWFLNLILSYILKVVDFISSFKIFVFWINPKIRPIFLLSYLFLFFYYFKLKKEVLFLEKNE